MGSSKDTASVSSKFVVKASKKVENWLSEDFDFHDFYDRNNDGGEGIERSVSKKKTKPI
jgi:hypothetical protein